MSDFSLERVGTKVTVVVGRELSASIVPSLFELLRAIEDDGVHDLALDLSQTTHVDAAGIHLLLCAHNSFSRKDGSMQLVRVSREIWSLLETLRLSRHLNAQME